MYIREYYRSQGRKVWKVREEHGGPGAVHDLIDGMGAKWEVEHDRLWHGTGNVYVEIQPLEASQADKYLIFRKLT